MQNNILERMRASFNDLTKTERRIASAILENPQRAAYESIASLAARINVSQPSVFRFCKRFGYKGFPDFKYALSAYTFSELPNIQISQNISEKNIFNIICQEKQQTISKLQEIFNQTESINFIKKIINSNRCIIFSNSNNRIFADILYHTLIKIDKPCEKYQEEYYLKPQIKTLYKNDVLIFLFTSPSDDFARYLEQISLVDFYYLNLFTSNTSELHIDITYKLTNLSADNSSFENKLMFVNIFTKAIDLYTKISNKDTINYRPEFKFPLTFNWSLS